MDRNLAAFLAVAETRNLTLASERIGLAQPSLSKRLANLEQTLGVKLFERHRRGMDLTEAGQMFYRRARRMDQEFFQAREELAALRDTGLSRLRVGAGPLFSLNFIAPAFAALLKEMPTLRMDLIANTNNHTLPLLMNGTLDIVFGVLELSKIDDSIVSRQLTMVEHGVVVAADDPLAAQGYATAEDLAGHRWVVYSDDPETENWLSGYFFRQGLAPPPIAVRTSSFSNGLDVVRSGGFAMIAPVQLQSRIAASGLAAIPTNPAITELPAGAYARSSSLSYLSVRRFIECVEQELQRDVAAA